MCVCVCVCVCVTPKLYSTHTGTSTHIQLDALETYKIPVCCKEKCQGCIYGATETHASTHTPTDTHNYPSSLPPPSSNTNTHMRAHLHTGLLNRYFGSKGLIKLVKVLEPSHVQSRKWRILLLVSVVILVHNMLEYIYHI